MELQLATRFTTVAFFVLAGPPIGYLLMLFGLETASLMMPPHNFGGGLILTWFLMPVILIMTYAAGGIPAFISGLIAASIPHAGSRMPRLAMLSLLTAVATYAYVLLMQEIPGSVPKALAPNPPALIPLVSAASSFICGWITDSWRKTPNRV